MIEVDVYDTCPGEIIDPKDVEACSIVGETLVKEYSMPAAKHGIELSWSVECIHKQGILKVTIDNLHAKGNQRYGEVADIRGLVTYDMLRDKAKSMGGALLERAFVSRTTGQRTKEEVDRS